MVAIKKGHTQAVTTFKCCTKGQQEERIQQGKEGVAKIKMKNSVALVKDSQAGVSLQ